MTKNEAINLVCSIHENEPWGSAPLLTLEDCAIAAYLIEFGYEESAENIALVRREGEDVEAPPAEFDGDAAIRVLALIEDNEPNASIDEVSIGYYLSHYDFPATAENIAIVRGLKK